MSVSLARKLSNAAFISRRQVGVLLNRKGEVHSVMVGDATRLYLPDIGRLRGASTRLRGLRLIVARPTPLNVLDAQFTLSHDFKTDLEKLRLDAVVEIDACRDKVDGPLVLGHLAVDKFRDEEKLLPVILGFRSVHEIKTSLSDLIDSINQDLRDHGRAKEVAQAEESFQDRAILVGVYQTGKKEGQMSMAELSELARSARVAVVESIFQWRPKSYPKTLIGPGKLEEICLRALSLGVETLIFDLDLTPSQLMNITDLTDLKVLDRTMLILDIFAQRAVTREGKLQVEMAQLSYSLPRLAQKQTGLSRLTGGIGGRGPGETKLEINRRRVKERLARLEDELDRIRKQRELRRKVRKANLLPTLAIVGYTNAGKSTLINALSGSNIYAKDELFATLDPHSRRLRFPHDQEVLITDTVGFINHLPESLMKAFMATLEELNDADIMLHVVDIANPNYLMQIQVVEKVLCDLELDAKNTILVINKIDQLSKEELIERRKTLRGLAISAVTGQGLPDLIDTASQILVAKGSQALEKPGDSSKKAALEVAFDERGQERPRFTKRN
ncbi:MAG TPA: GTPase HflX [Myxococcota bacterium]|nr:GTPase HflX [Myxococcota bacterium]